MTTLLEFAIVLFLKRKLEMVNSNTRVSALNLDTDQVKQIESNPVNGGIFEVTNCPSIEKIPSGKHLKAPIISFNKMKTGLCNNISLATQIDIIMFWLFTLTYLMFNIIYWNVYL